MARKKRRVINEPVIATLRDACQARFEQLNELLNDRRIPLDAREVIEAKVRAVEYAWGLLPDTGMVFEIGPND